MTLSNSSYLEEDTFPNDFISREFVYSLFHKKYKTNRSYVSHLCSSNMTEHMYKIIKRLKKEYIKNKLIDLDLFNPVMLSRGSFGGVYTLFHPNNYEYVLKITGQCKFRHTGGKIIKSWNTPNLNEIRFNQLIYNKQYNGLNGYNYVVNVYGGLFILCNNRKCIIHNYFKNVKKEEKIWMSNLIDKTESYLAKQPKNLKFEILISIADKFLNGIPIAYVIPKYLNNIEFILLFSEFLYEFLLISNNTQIDNTFGISHNDLHCGNILFDTVNNLTKKSFKVIDFGLAEKKTTKNKDYDKMDVINRVLIQFPIFKDFSIKIGSPEFILNRPIEQILIKFINFLKLQ